ncbi:hypothetical protein SBA3_3990004 [Candidatus Sulfopaludibacter sp. SbA3]|nr:hypothetical protein SBA3_3990004 [Candidatus Sulfopaludibacter sp. SbA3]
MATAFFDAYEMRGQGPGKAVALQADLLCDLRLRGHQPKNGSCQRRSLPSRVEAGPVSKAVLTQMVNRRSSWKPRREAKTG